MSALDLFQFVFVDNKAEKTLFLLHGTGGSEHDLLPLVKELSDQYNFVGIKGNISEHGMARFFERDERGVFNQDSISTQTHKLAEFVEAWKNQHSVSTEQTAFLGYSNGATMILALSFHFPQLVRKAVVLHPMLPFNPGTIQLDNTYFMITYGEQDEMIPVHKTIDAIAVLEKLGAHVHISRHKGGHEVQQSEVLDSQSFLQSTI